MFDEGEEPQVGENFVRNMVFFWRARESAFYWFSLRSKGKRKNRKASDMKRDDDVDVVDVVMSKRIVNE